MARSERKDKWQILAALAAKPGVTRSEASYQFGVNRHTISKWCKEAGINLPKNKHPRVSFVLSMKRHKRKRLVTELAKLEREIKVLEQLSPSDPYIKPKARK